MNPPNQITFTLKQHTPLIHFQHDQDGATLRATELKPKLDSFLIKKCNEDVKKYIIKDSSGKEFLKYKVDVCIKEGAKAPYFDIDYFAAGDVRNKVTLVLANMGKTEEEKKHFVYNDEIIVKIYCLNKDLLTIIKQNFCSFLFRNNFGTRQSKGFGSFYLSEKDPNFELPNSKFHFSLPININKQEELFESINLFWRALRGGINNGRRENGRFVTSFYFKSLMFLYAKTNNIQWEKKTIKSILFYDKLRKQIDEKPTSEALTFTSPNRYLMKDMLGLSMTEKWKAFFEDDITKKHVFKNEKNEWVESEKIERLKSPITFKPIYNYKKREFEVFVLVNIIPSEIREEYFVIKNNIKQPVKIQFPPKEYHISGFFKFLFEKNTNSQYSFNLENHVEDRFKKQGNSLKYEWKVIKDIIEQIRKNIN